ncbi:MAG: RNA polymerase sigma factor [Paracoccaceae bacterium]
MSMPYDTVSNAPDDVLLQRYAAGDRSAARMLTARLTPVVFAQAYRGLGNQADAEDVTQDALMRLWRHAPDWRMGEAKVTTWLYRVTANLCTDKLRKRIRSGPSLDEIAEPADPTPSVETTLQNVSRQKALEDALDELPERQREAVVLRHIEGLNNPDIANRLDVSVEAVESLLARGKRALKSALAGKKDALGYENG